MSRQKKILKKLRKAWKRALSTWQVNWRDVCVQMMKDAVWNTTPDQTSISVEAMLFSVRAEIDEWPEAWAHRHYFRSVSRADLRVCICGICEHGNEPYIDSRMRARAEHVLPVCSTCREKAVAWLHAENERRRQTAPRVRLPDGREVGFGDFVEQPLYDTQGAPVGSGAVIGIPLEMGPPQRDD